MTGQFVHLHVHTEYSMLDGAAKIAPLFTEAERLDQSALAMTDHGNMFGSAEFYRESLQHNVKPIIGIEAYLSPEHRSLREPVLWGPEGSRDDVGGQGAHTHITLLAENSTGLRNLFTLSTLASFEGFYRRPRIDRELLSQYSEGIIATTGCPGSEVGTRLALGQFGEALAAAGEMQDIFGEGNYFLELMDHGVSIERRIRDGLIAIGRTLNIPPLATNDSHYVVANQAGMHDALLCVQTKATRDQTDRFRFGGSGYYLKSAREMREYWDREVLGACSNTLLIAERVQSYEENFAPRDLMPRIPLPPGETAGSLLLAAVQRGIEQRFPDGLDPQRAARVESELAIINQMGFPDYFLIVQDLVVWARSQHIQTGPGRGSAAGSLVAYLLGITALDPIEHDLFFERFINPERVSPPDIDIDFDDRRRTEILAYLGHKWGNAVQVATFGKILTRAALKDAARVIHGSAGYRMAEEIAAELPPPIHAIDMPLKEIHSLSHPRYDEAAPLRDMLRNQPWTEEIVYLAQGLEGLIRSTGVHACAVMLSSDPLLGLIPLWKRQSDGAIITGWDFATCEWFGALKIDALGSRTIGVIGDVVQPLGIDMATIPLDDVETYELLGSGRTVGVFQLEQEGAQRLMRSIEPDQFSDIGAALALYRPGPLGMGTPDQYVARKHGRKPIESIHPEVDEALRDVLGDTYGLIVYQEQVMAMAQAVSGYTLGRADILRRAMGKKKPEVLRAEHEGFREGMAANGYSTEACNALWAAVVPFADYGFVRAHAASYAMIAYWCAYLKVHYPVQFMAAQLSGAVGDPERTTSYLSETRRMGIAVLCPDVNESGTGFTALPPTSVRFGLGAVRGVGPDAATRIVANAPYESIQDFQARSGASSTALTSLINAGALDRFIEHSRARLLGAVTEIAPVVAFQAQLAQLGLPDPLAGFHVGPAAPGYREDFLAKLAAEHHALGLYVSGHPLDAYEVRDLTPASVVDRDRPGEVAVCGIVSSVSRRMSKAGNPYAVLTATDMGGTLDLLWFEDGPLPREGAAVALSARVQHRNGRASVVCQDWEVLDRRRPSYRRIEVAPDFEAVAVRAELNGESVHVVLTCGEQVITFLVHP